MSQLNLKKQTQAATTTPPTNYLGLYYDSGASAFKYLDETGTAFNFNSLVTTVSVVSANGLAGTVATATSTPAITLTTTINSAVLAGNGTAISAATTTGSGSTVVLNNGPTLIAPILGTPASGVATNLTGTASGLTAGTVTTNANLTGGVTSVGNAATVVTNANLTGGVTSVGNAATVITNANLTGPVTSTGNATAVTSNAITNAMLAQMGANTIRGNNTAGTANALDLTVSQATAMLNVSTQSLQGLQSATDKKKQDNFWVNAVADIGLDPTGSVDGLSTLNTYLTTIPDNTTVYFTKGTYKISGTITIPSGKHLTFRGDGPFKTTITTTSGTLDMVSVGDWYNEFHGITFTSTVTRTAGFAINGGSNVGIFVYYCEFSNVFNGFLSNGTLCGIAFSGFTNTVNFDIQFNGANVNSFVESCTFDCSPATVAHLEVNQCGSLLVSNCDIIRATNNLRINPTNPTGSFAIYCVNTFFDTAAGSSVKFMGSGNIQRAKFVNCWFSGSVTGCEFASTATILPTAIDFINCDIYSNSANGILGTAVQDIALSNCRVAGNTTAGISMVAATGAVTKLNVQNNTIGPTGNIGGNGTGILIASGTYGGYIVTGNNVAGNVTQNINDAGTVTGQVQKQINGNIGHLFTGNLASLVAATAAINTVETVLCGGVNVCPIPANAFMVGTRLRVVIFGTCTSTAANATTLRIKIGTNGSTADTAVMTVATPVAATSGTAIPFQLVLYLTVRTLGAAATATGHMDVRNQSGALVATASTGIMPVPTQIVAGTMLTWSTLTANYITVTHQTGAATTTNTIQEAVLEVL